MTVETQMSDVVSTATATADRLRAQNRPLPVFGQRTEKRTVQKRGVLGRVQDVQETVHVPVHAPGWPVGLSTPVLQNGSNPVVHDIMLAPNGVLLVVRVDPDKLLDSRPVSRSTFGAIRTVQCAAAVPEWIPTGSGSGTAANFPIDGIHTTAAEAAAMLTARLQTM
ncbi:hypothetical protein L5G32_17220 [Gordonia sp. HY002]|uniref:hypothetical protein n=1 Tax=Gordonia zhenghanii TaxID=2911516 RepID=UPI001EEF9079|nr:hypothetical protein [Gordonia zhenghanii]MCF8572011.1 hypothetical protein [Gordonia zhenghanii]MCF8606642.1 hypothetical protein [Gordonia zhenghanii]